MNNFLPGILAIIVGYFLGSIPSAYLITRLVSGKDIRKLGGGNVGGLNTYREVGRMPAIAVIVIDIGKGAAAIAVAYWLFGLRDLGQPWVLLAGLAAIIGHNWMPWLKFKGGKGMGATIGIVAVALPLYGFWVGVPIFLAIVFIPLFITNNIALSMGLGLIVMPFLAWLGAKSGMLVSWSLLTAFIIAVKFFPTARAAWVNSRNKKDFVFDKSRR